MQYNPKLFYETLCKRIAVCIIENDAVQLKRMKSIVYKNFINNETLHNELSLYNEIATSNFSDRDVAKSFLEEILKVASKTSQAKIDECTRTIANAHKTILESVEVSDDKDAQLYNNIYTAFQYVRTADHTIQETKQYYRAYELLVRHLNSNNPELVIEQSQSSNINWDMVLEVAVKRFNDKYSNLSPTKHEIIQDFLNFRSIDRLKSSLLGRLKKAYVQLEEYGKQNPEIEKLPKLLSNLQEYYNKVSKDKSNTDITQLILNVCDFVELTEEIQK